MTIKIDAAEATTNQLESILQAIEANRGEFAWVDAPPPKHDRPVTPDELRQLMRDDSGLLIEGGHPVFAYIQDHGFRTLRDWGGPDQMRRLHFSVCQTLDKMKKSGKFEGRYRITNSTSNKYTVDVKAGMFEKGDKVQKTVPLRPCKYCLSKLNYLRYRDSSDHERERIFCNFNAQDAMEMLDQWFSLFRLETARLKNANLPTGYTDDWREVSRDCRARNGWKCSKCGVDLSHNKGMLDVHHRNGDKCDNTDENLQCLCKACHGQEHPHYHIRGEVMRTIERAKLGVIGAKYI